ncbi:MAG: preprotein translocase subunit SecE [Bacteroidota bacterium]
MDSIILYIKESYNELVYKVTWPNWKSLQSNTILVIIASLIFAGIIFVMDFVAKNGLNIFYDLFQS